MTKQAQFVVANYARMFPMVDRKDLEQEVELAALEAARTYRPDGGASPDTYKWKAALWRVREYAWATSLPVSGHVSAIPKMKELVACELQKAFESESPIDSPEQMLHRKRWALALRALLAEQPRGDLAEQVLLGEEKPATVARRHGVPVRIVYDAAERARRAIKDRLACWAD